MAGREGWVWKNPLGLVAYQVGSSFYRIGSVLCLLGLSQAGGKLALSSCPTRQCLHLSHERFCHLARGGGGSSFPLGPSSSPTTHKTVHRRDCTPLPATTPSHYITCLFQLHFSATKGEERKRKAHSPSFLSQGINKKPVA